MWIKASSQNKQKEAVASCRSWEMNSDASTASQRPLCRINLCDCETNFLSTRKKLDLRYLPALFIFVVSFHYLLGLLLIR